MVAETGLPNLRSVVQFRDGTIGVVVRFPIDEVVEGVDKGSVYILSPADHYVRQKSISLPDGRSETALAFARDLDSGHTLLAIEGDLNGTYKPCLLASRLPKTGDEVSIYHEGSPLKDTLPIKSQVTGVSPDGGIIINLVWDKQFEKAPGFNGAGDLIGFLSRRNPGEGTWSSITPVNQRFGQESIKKIKDHLRANNVSISLLKTDPVKYSEMRNVTAYRPSALGFSVLYSPANSGYVVARLNDTIDPNGDLTIDRFHPGNRLLSIYADSDLRFKGDFMTAKVMTITGLNSFDYYGNSQFSQFGVQSFETFLKEIEQFADLGRPVEITAMCIFADNTPPVEKKYTLTAQDVIEDVKGKKRTRKNYELPDRVRDGKPSLVIETLDYGVRITDTKDFLGLFPHKGYDSATFIARYRPRDFALDPKKQ